MGAVRGGASHISTSFELSESFNMTTFSGSCWVSWIEMYCDTSLAFSALLSECSLEDEPSTHSDWVDSLLPPFLAADTTIKSSGLSDKEEVGVSVSLDVLVVDSLFNRFVSGCCGTGVLAFLFPRSRLVSEGLLNDESNLL